MTTNDETQPLTAVSAVSSQQAAVTDAANSGNAVVRSLSFSLTHPPHNSSFVHMKTRVRSPPSVPPNKNMYRRRDPTSLLMCVIFTLLCISSTRCSNDETSLSPAGNSTDSDQGQTAPYIDPRTTLECHRREYTFKAVRYDESGRKCWQFVTVMSCWGRCDSGEIADWRFPFKQSYHPICGHDKKRMRKIRLKNCDAGVEDSLRSYKIAEAVSCSCRVCHSSLASCEGLPHISTRSV